MFQQQIKVARGGYIMKKFTTYNYHKPYITFSTVGNESNVAHIPIAIEKENKKFMHAAKARPHLVCSSSNFAKNIRIH